MHRYDQGAKLAGIIYMHRISDVRMGGTSKRNFRIFRELCEDSTLRNVLIVTNMWSNVDPKVGEAREQELANNNKFFKPVLEKGAKLLRHSGTQPSALSILRHLINTQTATLLIQHELVNEHKDLAHTAAGAELTRALKEQADHHDEELKKLRKELEAATVRATRYPSPPARPIPPLELPHPYSTSSLSAERQSQISTLGYVNPTL